MRTSYFSLDFDAGVLCQNLNRGNCNLGYKTDDSSTREMDH